MPFARGTKFVFVISIDSQPRVPAANRNHDAQSRHYIGPPFVSRFRNFSFPLSLERERGKKNSKAAPSVAVPSDRTHAELPPALLQMVIELLVHADAPFSRRQLPKKRMRVSGAMRLSPLGETAYKAQQAFPLHSEARMMVWEYCSTFDPGASIPSESSDSHG